MNQRTETALLGVATTMIGAFVVSFGMGVDIGSAASAAPEPVVLRATAPEPRESPIAVLEVLNAAGKQGLARRATEQLREAGFDVVYFGNARSGLPDSSAVIDRVGSLAVARRVADELGIERVRSVPDSTLYIDATVVLGVDWRPVSRGEGGEDGWWAKVRKVFGRG